MNCIAPGLIKTDFAKALWDNPETLKASTARSPLLRIGEPDEIAGAAVFLASPAGDLHDRPDHRHRRRRDDQLRSGVIPGQPAGAAPGIQSTNSPRSRLRT